MKVTKGTYFKALLLLIAFSMGTVVSLACSFSDLFHEFHHHNTLATKAHSATHGDKNKKEHTHDHSGSHHHDGPEGEKKDDCCSESLIELQQEEKSVSRSIEVPHLISVTFFVSAYPELFSFQPEQKTIFPKNLRRRPLTTIQDLRIVIQSFQI